MSRWEFSALVPEDRQQTLHAAPSFETIGSRVAATMRVLCQHTDPCDEAAGYQRAVFCIRVEPQLFDLFFNSWNGYRAQYFREAENGDTRSIEFIRAISPSLLAAPGAEPNPQLAPTSLAGASAKVWLAEVGKGFCAQCAGEWQTAQDEEPEILNDRWELSAIPDAKNGRKAPFLTKLRIMGAYVNESAVEYVVVQKRQRAKQIHDIGWS